MGQSTQPQRSQPDDYWRSASFARRYTINNVAGVRDNQGAKEFDGLTFMAQAQGVQYLNTTPVNLLDVGCGHAVRGMRLASYFGIPVTGVDYSEPMLEQAGNLMKALPEERRATLVQASVEDMPFEDGQFDVAVCYGLLMSLPKLDKAVAEIMRVTKYGLVAVEETPTAMVPEQRDEWDRVRTKTFPGRIYWHDYLQAFGHATAVVYTPLPVPETWDMGTPPGYARFIVQKGTS